MKRYVLPLLTVGLLLVIVALVLNFIFFRNPNAGLQVNSIPQATVYLDGKEMGKTPYEETRLTPGEKDLKLVISLDGDKSTQWERKIKLNDHTLTLVNQEFGDNDFASQGEVITLESIPDKKTASLAIVSQPDAALVKVDGEAKGFSPTLLEKLSAGEHEMTFSAPDYKDRKVKTKFFNGYKAIISVKLASISSELPDLGSDLTTTPTPTTASAKPSGMVKATLTPTPKVRVTPSTTGQQVKILDTGLGWLRVRAEPSTAATELTKVNTGEQFPLLEEKIGWYKIAYEPEKEGWISSKYAEKIP